MLSSQPLLIAQDQWDRLCESAERLAAETHAMETEICHRAELHQQLGISKPLRHCLRSMDWSQPSRSVRTMRFDFHPTRHGWAVSEVNSDVPGGYTEASLLPALFTQFREYGHLPPSPLTAWGAAIESTLPPGIVVFLSASGYLEDHQVVRGLIDELSKRGIASHWIQSPSCLQWNSGEPRFASHPQLTIATVVRFYQAEWLCELPQRTNWRPLLSRAGFTTNPTISVFAESKRFPLLWPHLSASTATWRAIMPECRDPREIEAKHRGEWVLKASYSNTGDFVILGDAVSGQAWTDALRKARSSGAHWVAQRRFDTTPLDSVEGLLYPCIGVFVVNGEASGAYVRLSRGQLTDGLALEAPLFIKPNAEVTS